MHAVLAAGPRCPSGTARDHARSRASRRRFLRGRHGRPDQPAAAQRSGLRAPRAAFPDPSGQPASYRPPLRAPTCADQPMSERAVAIMRASRGPPRRGDAAVSDEYSCLWLQHRTHSPLPKDRIDRLRHGVHPPGSIQERRQTWRASPHRRRPGRNHKTRRGRSPRSTPFPGARVESGPRWHPCKGPSMRCGGST